MGDRRIRREIAIKGQVEVREERRCFGPWVMAVCGLYCVPWGSFTPRNLLTVAHGHYRALLCVGNH